MILRCIRKSFVLLWEVSPILLIIQFLINLIASFLPIAMPLLIKLVIDNLQEYTGRLALTGRNDIALLNYIILLVLAIVGTIFAGSVIGAIQGLAQDVLSKRLGFKITEKIVKKAMELDLMFFETPTFYDQLTRAQNEANFRPYTIVSGLFSVFGNTITVLGILVLLTAFNPHITLALVLLVVPLLVVQIFYSRKLYELNKDQTSGQRELLYFSTLMTNNQSAKEIKLFGLGNYLFGVYAQVFHRQVRESIHISVQRLVGITISNMIVLMCVGWALIDMTLQAASGAISLGSLAAYIGALVQLQGQIGILAYSITTLYENSLYLDNLFSFLTIQPTAAHITAPPLSVSTPAENNNSQSITPQPNRIHTPTWNKTAIRLASANSPKLLPLLLPLQEGYHLHDVSFCYPNATNVALKHVNLEIRPGETLALVGENGAGKSTLVKLLCRLYEPSSGTIRLNGNLLGDYDLEVLRRQIGVIFQDYTKYWLTARENIGFGDLMKLNDLEKINGAAKKSGADEVVHQLAQDYNTRLGVMWERSNQLSEGQWQRIALARAYLRDAPILILDEPTASLDAKVEYETFQRFRELTAGKIAVLISHRFNNVRMANRIAVLKGGEVIEQGTHDELLALGGHYAILFHKQAAGYQ